MAARLTRAQSQARTRQALMDAAAALIARRGYEATTVDQIAERAGLTRGAVYSNFSGKEDLLFAITIKTSGALDDPVFAERAIPFPIRLRLFARHLVAGGPRVRDAVLLYSELELLAIRNSGVRSRMAGGLQATLNQQGDDLESAARTEGFRLLLDGRSTIQVGATVIRGLLRESMFAPRLVTEQLLGDTLLALYGYRPADHPVPPATA